MRKIVSVDELKPEWIKKARKENNKIIVTLADNNEYELKENQEKIEIKMAFNPSGVEARIAALLNPGKQSSSK